MKNYTLDELIELGYKIENAKIESVDLSMGDHGCITLSMSIQGAGWGCVYGGFCLGHGYLGAKEFDSNEKAMVYLMRIMDTVGVERFNDLPGHYLRVATKSWGDVCKIIGHVITDKWFDPESFFTDCEDAVHE